jgi:hypothetical protein
MDSKTVAVNDITIQNWSQGNDYDGEFFIFLHLKLNISVIQINGKVESIQILFLMLKDNHMFVITGLESMQQHNEQIEPYLFDHHQQQVLVIIWLII